MKMILKNATRVLVVLCAMFMAYSCGAAVDKALKDTVDQMNDMCPQQVDEITTLDKVELGEGREIVMTYTAAISKDSEEFDQEYFDTTMKAYLLEGVKSPALASFRRFEVIITYIYLDENGEQLLDYSVTPEMYK